VTASRPSAAESKWENFLTTTNAQDAQDAQDAQPKIIPKRA
jgi:hypothetical protein